MKILIAPNSFKGSLSAFQISAIIEQAFLAADKNFSITKHELADGGDGTLEVLSKNKNGSFQELQTHNTLGDLIKSRYFLTESKTAIIELAKASGIKLLKNQDLDPLIANTYGTGELISDAIKNGAKKIILGIGGSATIDAGIGAALALDVHFFDMHRNKLTEVNEILEQTNSISTDHIYWKNDIPIEILCDVKNAVFGKDGGIKVYGPQKGADAGLISKRENQFRNYLKQLELSIGKDFKDQEYFGASGGFPITFKALFTTKLHHGAQYILNELDIEEKVKNSDVIITTEGRYDKSTLSGKVPFVLAKTAKKYQKPIFMLTGQTNFWDNNWFDGIFPIVSEVNSLENVLLNSEKLLFETSKQLALVISKITSKNG